MALNAHLAVFESTYGTPGPGLPTTDAEKNALAIPGASPIVTGTVTTPGANDTDPPTTENHPWIVLSGAQFSIRRLDLGGYSEPRGSVSHSGFEVVKSSDIASPAIARHCSAQTQFGSAKILFLDPSNNVIESIRLYNVTIESVRTTYNDDGSTSEAVTLQYEKICWHQINSDGAAFNDGWDRNANTQFAGPTP